MNKLPPLIELRAFDAAARHLSFKKAASELGVTPTAISHQIRQLERYCGRALFRRRPRPLTLTEAGARLFPIIRDGLERFVTAFAAVKRDGDAQPLRVTTTNAFASRWLVPRLPRWRKARPNAPLDVIGTDGVLDLHAGDADVAIRYARKLPTDGIAKEFLRDSFWPVCSPELLTSGLKRAADLRGHVLVHCYWSPSDLDAPTWQRWLSAAKGKWRDVPEFKEMDHLSFREELHASRRRFRFSDFRFEAALANEMGRAKTETGSMASAAPSPISF
jgi:LysR family glycine cleavage system transcriptional activator